MESSRFGSSGNLSQISSQLSETGQESAGGSELEESFHSYHSSSAKGQHPTNGHLPSNGHSALGEEEMRKASLEMGKGLNGSMKKEALVEKKSNKLQR